MYYQCNIIYNVTKLYLENSGFYLLDRKMLRYNLSVRTLSLGHVDLQVYLGYLQIKNNGTLRNSLLHSYLNLKGNIKYQNQHLAYPDNLLVRFIEGRK